MEIVIPFAQISAINPNISQALTDDSDNYFKCLIVSFTSIRKFNPKTQLVLATNKMPREEYLDVLTRLQIEVRIIEFVHDPIAFGVKRFRGCFYIFDVILNSTESTLYLDPDVLCIADLQEIEVICNNKIGIFPISIKSNYRMNGLTPTEARGLWEEFIHFAKAKNEITNFNLLGGEILYIPENFNLPLKQIIATFLMWNTTRAQEGRQFFPTEEHIFTNMLAGFKTVKLNPIISRIWTTKTFVKHQGNRGDIRNLKLWHLPSEKNRGFVEVYDDIMHKNELMSLDGDDYLRRMKIKFHIDQKTNQISSFLFGRIIRTYRKIDDKYFRK